MQRKRHTPEFKVKVALEALKGNKTINEIAGEMGIHATQITQWKKQAQEGLKEVFTDRRGKAKSQEPSIEELYQNIGRLQVELEWLKKNLALPLESKRRLVEPDHSEISIARQCELLGLNRSSYYYEA
ncbi:MAG: transposase, partial [Cyanobacteriota bacterium]|nr:transposase [Cyanobacteriota bacterium]